MATFLVQVTDKALKAFWCYLGHSDLVADKGQSWMLQIWDIHGSKKTFITFQEKESSLCLNEGMSAQYMVQRSAVHASQSAGIVQEQEGK